MAASLEEELFGEPYRFGFFQAVRLLERLAPGRPQVGRDGPAAGEPVRFRVPADLLFPPSEIRALDRPAEPGATPEMTVAFLGLIGPMGVLPHAYTELVQARRRAGDATAAAFLDLFHHRLISFFYRAWLKYRPALAHERGEDDPFADYLFDLIGLGLDPLRDRHAFPDQALLFHAGSLAQRRRPAVALEALLADYFGRPVEVVPFIGRWLRLEPGDRSVMGRDGPHNALGVSVVVGERTWDEQSRFRLRVGPLSFDEFLALQPDTPAFRELAEMTRLFVDAEFEFEVQLVLRADAVPECRLDSSPGAVARLGRSAWLRSRPADADADEAVFAATA